MRLAAGLLSSLLVALVCVAYAVNAGQDMNWDLQNYHLYAPYAFLNDRHLLDLSPSGLQSYFNPVAYVPYYWLVHNVPPRTIASLLAILQSFNFILLFAIALQVLPEKPGKTALSLALALMGLLTVGFISELGATQFDNVLSLFVLGALLVVLYAMNHYAGFQRVSWFGMAGFLAGLGCALKLVLGVYALGLCIAMVFLRLPIMVRLRLICVYSLGVVAGLLLCGGFWYLFMLENFGNPVFPLFNSIFGGELAQTIANRDTRFLPVSIIDYLAYPVIFTMAPSRVSEIAYEQFSWLLIYVVILLFALWKMVLVKVASVKVASVKVTSSRCEPLSANGRLLLGFFVASFILWLVLFGIYRYLISIEVLVPLLTIVLIGNLDSRRAVEYVTVAGLACLTWINSSGAANWGHAGWSDQVYRVENPAGFENADKLFLIGQPLGWLVPAFATDRPFIQIAPNFPVSETYLRKVSDHVADSNRLGIIYNPLTINIDAEIPYDDVREFFPPEVEIDINARNTPLELYFGMDVDDFECNAFIGSFGLTEFSYQFCLQRGDSEDQLQQ